MTERSGHIAPRRFSRFSLLSLLLLTGLIGVSVSHFRLTAEIQRLQQQNNELKKELGYIAIEDPKKAYTRELASLDATQWRFRVYLPPGKRYHLRIRDEWVDEDFPRSTSGSGPIQPEGEFTLTVGFSQDALGRWQVRITMPGNSQMSTIQEEKSKWLADPRFVGSNPLGGTQTELDPDKRVQLIRWRAESTRQGETPKSPADGFMIWLEPSSGP